MVTIKPKIPELSAKNQMVQQFFRKLYSKISVHPISRVRNGKSENCVSFDHFSFFKPCACTRYKGYYKKKIGKRFENYKGPPFSCGKIP